MASLWDRIRDRISPPRKEETVRETVTTPPVYSAEPSPTGPTKITQVTPSQTTTVYSGPSSSRPSPSSTQQTNAQAELQRQQAQQEAALKAEQARQAKAEYDARQAEEKARREAVAKAEKERQQQIVAARLSQRTQQNSISSYDKSATQSIKQAGSNIAYNVGQFLTGRQQYIRDPLAPVKTKEIKEQFIGGQSGQNTYLVGDKEVTIYDKPLLVGSPTGRGTTGVYSYGTTETIKPDQSISSIRRIEEQAGALKYVNPLGLLAGKASPYISGAFGEEVYIKNQAQADKYTRLLEEGKAKELREFLREQQAELKRDIGRYNVLSMQGKTEEATKLAYEIQTAYRGTGWNILKTGAETYTAEGRKVMGVAPGVLAGSLYGLTKAYEVEKSVLGFQIGAGAVGGVLGTTKAGTALLTGVSRVSKGLGGLTALGGGGMAISSAISTDKRYDYTPYTIGAGIGTAGGFFGSLYSRQVVTGIGKGAKAIGRGFKFTGEQIGRVGSMEVPTIKGKRASLQVSQYADEVVEIVYQGKKIKVLKSELWKYRPSESQIREALTFTKSGKTVRVKTFSEKIEDVKKVLAKLKGATPEQKAKTLRLLEDVYGKAELNRLITEVGLQEGLTPLKTVDRARPDVLRFFDSSFGQTTPPIKTLPLVADTAPVQKLVRPTSQYAGLGLYERTSVSGLLGLSAQSQRTISGVSTLLRYRLDSRQDSRTRQDTRTALATLTGMRSDTRQRTNQASGLTSASATDSSTAQRTSTTSFSGTLTGVTQKPTTQQDLGFGFGGGGGSGTSRPQPTKPTRPQFFSFDFPDEKKRRLEGRQEPYDAYVKRDATKKEKARWEQVADNVPLVTALSKGAKEADNTPSTEFKVIKDKGKVNKIIDTAWYSLQNKFRSYTQKSGIKVGLRPGRYLEKKKHRIDTPGEVKGISRKGQVSISRRFGRL